MERIIRHSLLSGILVGVGVVINIKSTNQFIGSMLFSIALLTIIECGLSLYTGKIGFYDKTVLKELIVILIGNLLGVIIPILVLFTQNDIYIKLYDISTVKFNSGYSELFLRSFMCGILMFVAVYCKKIVITIFCIMVFILSGYEHCIANFPYLCINFNMQNFIKFFCMIAGNSIGSIITNKLIK